MYSAKLLTKALTKAKGLEVNGLRISAFPARHGRPPQTTGIEIAAAVYGPKLVVRHARLAGTPPDRDPAATMTLLSA
jgi:hypothetical protein